tara:strand:- start:52 stop:336 length:285 start_codon:yes stop_codon:yes gene_type:complete
LILGSRTVYYYCLNSTSSELFRGSIRAMSGPCEYESFACSSNQRDRNINSLGSVDVPEVMFETLNVRSFRPYFVANWIGLIIACERGDVFVEGG